MRVWRWGSLQLNPLSASVSPTVTATLNHVDGGDVGGADGHLALTC